MKIIENEADLKSAMIHLKSQCLHLAPYIDENNLPTLRRTEGGFLGLVRIIVFQQISIHAGRSIWERVQKAFPVMLPQEIYSKTEDDLRALGLSRPKIKTIKNLCEALLNKVLTEQEMNEGSEKLTSIKGIGPWTLTVYRLTAIGDADVFPAGDLALQEQMKTVLGLEKRPDEKETENLSLRWQPFRAVAARVLWQAYTLEKLKKSSDLPL